MTISFKNYPVSNRVPGVYGEVDNSRANSGTINQRTLIIGQMTSAGTGTANVPVISAGIGEARTLAGPGSMLASMLAKYRDHDSFGEVWLLPLADDGSSTKASATIAITGTATSSGSYAVYAGGLRFAIGVAAGESATIVTTRLIAALCNQELPFSVAIGGKTLALTNPATPGLATDATSVSITGTTVLTLTFLHGGAVGNDADLRLNYGGSPAGEVAPTGMTVTLAGFSGGAVNPSLTAAMANLGDTAFDYIVLPYTDTTSLATIGAALNDVTGRWAWNRMIYGHAFTAAKGTLGALTTLGTGRNDQHVSIMGYNDSPTPSYLWAAAFGGASAVSLRADPAIPVTQIAMQVMAPPHASRFVISERNTLLYDGVSTFVVDDAGNVLIERAVTTYQMTAGVADNSYLDVETMATLAFVQRDLKAYLATTFARKKLVSDTTRITSNQPNLVTAALIKAAVIQRYRMMEGQGMVQNSAQFAKEVVVENAGNGLVKCWWPGDLANQLRAIAILVSFTKD